jgi:two-component system chemotaxis sensor kinase CheA
MDLSQFTQAFFVEAIELLAQMEQLLLAAGSSMQPDSEQLNAIFRAAHSIKGGAATFGFSALDGTRPTFLKPSWTARDTGSCALSAPMIDAFLETKDALQDQLTAYQANREPEADMRRAHLWRASTSSRSRERRNGSASAAAPTLHQRLHPPKVVAAAPAPAVA